MHDSDMARVGSAPLRSTRWLTAHLPQTDTPEIGTELDLRLKADSIVVLQDGAGVVD